MNTYKIIFTRENGTQAAEAEVIQLKAKLYDLLVSPAGEVGPG